MDGMKVMICGTQSNRNRCFGLDDYLQEAGMTSFLWDDIQSASHDRIDEFGKTGESYQEYVMRPDIQIAAEWRLNAMKKVDAAVFVLPGNLDSATMFGIALALGKITVILGQPERSGGEVSAMHSLADAFSGHAPMVPITLKELVLRREFLKTHGKG